MASITLDRDECGEGFLPPVCIRCGEAATGVRKQFFQWWPPLLNVLIVICVPCYVILYLIMRKSVTVALPVCDQHRSIWFRRNLFQVLGIVLMVGSVVMGFTFGNEIDKQLRIQGAGAAITITGLLSGCLFLFLSTYGTIRPTRITHQDVTLTGLSPVFCDTVEQYRILLEDED